MLTLRAEPLFGVSSLRVSPDWRWSGGMTPCPLVLIEWEDSAQPTCAWEHLADWKPGGVVRIASVGWLIKDGKRVKALAPNMGGIDGKASVQVSGVIRIPTRSVISVTRLEEV